jgi:D-amino peptidase
MKILIADDMEGITGVVDWNQVDPAHAEYTRFRKIMTADVNAAVRGAINAGADEVIISDGHNGGRNVLIEELDPRARLNSGSPSQLSMVEGVSNHVDAVLLIGYHARAGAINAILCHTWADKIINVWLNDRVTGEIGLNSSVAGWFGAPILMISGCAAACAEACEWIEGIQTAVVKTASGRFAAECLTPSVTQAMIEQTAERSVRSFIAGQGPKALKVETPVRIKVEFANAAQADNAAIMPDTVRVDGRTVEAVMPDMPSAYRAFRAMTSLGR